jgi:hypothetical protein
MTTVNVSSVDNTIVVTENGSTTVVQVPQTSVVTAVTAGPQGPRGAASAGYEFIQNTSAVTWTINHNLGYKPSVDVYDSGSQQIQVEISHPSINQTVILFTASTPGFARLT